MEEFKKTFEKLKDNPMYQSYCSMLETKDKVIKRLVEENTQLKEQRQELRSWLEENKELKSLYETQTNFNKELLNKFAKKDRVLKELRSWLEEMLDNESDIFSVVRVKDVLSKLNELEGGKNEN